MTEPNRLTRGEDSGGTRHFLDGEPVHCGEALELRLDDGTWFPLRFETKSNGTPIGCWEVCSGHQATVPLAQYSVLRWPVAELVTITRHVVVPRAGREHLGAATCIGYYGTAAGVKIAVIVSTFADHRPRMFALGLPSRPDEFQIASPALEAAVRAYGLRDSDPEP